MYLNDAYKLAIILADAVNADGPVNTYDTYEKFQAERIERHSLNPPVIGYRIINRYTGTVANGCKPWHNTPEGAIEDYNRNILHLNEDTATTLSGLRKPTLLEEIKGFDITQMAAFIEQISGGQYAESIYTALSHAKQKTYSKGEILTDCEKMLAFTDESADACVPDKTPVIDGSNSFSIVIPEGYFLIKELDGTGKGIQVKLCKRNGEEVAVANISRDKKYGIAALHYATSENNFATEKSFGIYSLPKIIPGSFDPEMERPLLGILFDQDARFKENRLLPEDRTWQIHTIAAKRLMLVTGKEENENWGLEWANQTENPEGFCIEMEWGNPFATLSVCAKYQSVKKTYQGENMPPAEEPETHVIVDKKVDASKQDIWSILTETFDMILSWCENHGMAEPF